jgi:hypothetical protein
MMALFTCHHKGSLSVLKPEIEIVLYLSIPKLAPCIFSLIACFHQRPTGLHCIIWLKKRKHSPSEIFSFISICSVLVIYIADALAYSSSPGY